MPFRSDFESTATVLREYLEATGWDDEEFGRRLKKGDPAAAIIFAASRLAAEIGSAAQEIVTHCARD